MHTAEQILAELKIHPVLKEQDNFEAFILQITNATNPKAVLSMQQEHFLIGIVSYHIFTTAYIDQAMAIATWINSCR